jgi:hypothetical protein
MLALNPALSKYQLLAGEVKSLKKVNAGADQMWFDSTLSKTGVN